MPQSEMEALIQLQKETIESLRQLVDSQRRTIEQMARSHEEQTGQMDLFNEAEAAADHPCKSGTGPVCSGSSWLSGR